MARREKIAVTADSAFHALGLPAADDLILRSALIRKAGDVARRKALSQSAIGKILGMEQPRVSALLAGKISLFSTDRLVAALIALGQDVEVRVRTSKSGRGKLSIAA
jgi:predicted XRE-type DNA-binding protein